MVRTKIQAQKRNKTGAAAAKKNVKAHNDGAGTGANTIVNGAVVDTSASTTDVPPRKRGGGKGPVTKASAKARAKESRAAAVADAALAVGSPISKRQKKKRTWRSGTVALREIRRYQKSTELLIPKMPFRRLVHEVAQEWDLNGTVKFTAGAMEALQQATETLLTELLDATELVTDHAGRKTIMPRDLLFAATQCCHIKGVTYTPPPISNANNSTRKKQKRKRERKDNVSREMAAALTPGGFPGDDDDFFAAAEPMDEDANGTVV